MATAQQVRIVSHVEIAKLFHHLDTEVSALESLRNEDGGFDVELGVAPGTSSDLHSIFFFSRNLRYSYCQKRDTTIKISVKISTFGEVIVEFHQSQDQPVLRKHQELGFECFVLTCAVQNIQSISAFLHDVNRYLLAETGNSAFEFTLYMDWLKAKKDFESTIGMPPIESIDEANQGEDKKIDSELDLNSRLYQLASGQASFSASINAQKVEWYQKKIRGIYGTEVKAIKKERLPSGKIRIPGSKPETTVTPTFDFMEYLTEIFESNKPLLSWIWKKLPEVPTIVSKCIALQEVNLGFNDLRHIPHAVFQLPFLRKLFLSNNRLTSLPPVSGCPLLEVLDVHSNRLTMLPDDLQFLPLLQTLQLEWNSLRVIPSYLANMKRLQYLDFSNNLVNIIPPELCRCEQLTYLRFHRNPVSNLPPSVYMEGTTKVLEYLRSRYIDEGGLIASDMIEDLAALEHANHSIDIFFKPRGASPIPAHRIMIAARAPKLYSLVLKLELSIPGPDGTARPVPPKDDKGRSIIPLNDMEPQTFAYLKTWIYTGKFEPELPKITEILKPTFEQEKEQQQLIAQRSRVLSKVQKVAETYDLPHLLNQVECKLMGTSNKVVPSTLHTAFSPFIGRPTLSDVTFVVEGDHRVPGHRALLCARSEFFRNMFEAGLKEAMTGEISLPDISRATLWSILAFCYKDEAVISPDNAMELLTASKVYHLPKLGDLVESVISFSLDVENVVSIYQTAKLYAYPLLLSSCENYIASNWVEICKVPAFNELTSEERQLLNNSALNWKVIPDIAPKSS